MTSANTQGLVTDIAGLRDHAGTHVGYTDWQEMTQERVNQFADATDDHQFIHVDPEKAKQTPFGGTIAHGFLTLSLVAPISQQLMKVTDAIMGVNYGLDRVRFPAPLPVGGHWRGDGDPRGDRHSGWPADQGEGHDRGQGLREAGVRGRIARARVRRPVTPSICGQ
jgi:hypothetical protein